MSLSELWMLTEQKRELVLLSIEAEKLLKIAADLTISCEKTAQEGLNVALLARKWQKQVDDNRKEITRPVTEYARSIADSVKPISEKLADIEKEISIRVHCWMQNNDTQNLDCELGKITTKESYTFELDNIECVPAEYLMIDEKKIKEALKNGVRIIPGVTIVREKELSMRLKNDA